jgi:hypothetical protein
VVRQRVVDQFRLVPVPLPVTRFLFPSDRGNGDTGVRWVVFSEGPHFRAVVTPVIVHNGITAGSFYQSAGRSADRAEPMRHGGPRVYARLGQKMCSLVNAAEGNLPTTSIVDAAVTAVAYPRSYVAV